jgi:putative salt-induced outer membrane protein YdiY
MGRKKTDVIHKDAKLNDEQIKFCELYALSLERGHGVNCYANAYGIDLTEKGGYATAKVNASKLLTNTNILEYIRELFEDKDLNDIVVDNELAFVIKQNADFGSKVAAIKEYNALKTRVKNKLEVQVDNITVGYGKEED